MEDASSESAVVGIDAAAFGELFEISGRAFVGLLLNVAHPEGFGAVRVSQTFEQEGGFVEERCLFGLLEEHEFKDAQEEVGLVVFFGEIGKEAEGFVVFGGLEDLLEELIAVGRSEGAVDLFDPREVFPLEGLGQEFGCDFLEGEAVSVDADGLGDKGAVDGGEAFGGLEELREEEVAFFVEGLELIEHLVEGGAPEGEVSGFDLAQGEGLDHGLGPDFGECFADGLDLAIRDEAGVLEGEEIFLCGEEVLDGEVVMVVELDLGEPRGAFFGEELVRGGAFDDLKERGDGFGRMLNQRVDGIGGVGAMCALLAEHQEGFGAGLLVSLGMFARKGGEEGVGGLFGPRALEEGSEHLDHLAGVFGEFSALEIGA